MCVIACKPAGVAAPKMKRLETCWENNPQGAGVAWWNAADRTVQIEKGMMTWGSFEAFIKKLYKTIDVRKTAIVYHFRITSAGETVAGQCHPFPLSRTPDDLRALRITSPVAVAHNGTMPITSYKTLNDTQTFIIDYLMDIAEMCPRFFENKAAERLIATITESKLAFLSGNKIHTIGKFIKADDKCLYSNSGYEEWDYGDYYESSAEWWANYRAKNPISRWSSPTMGTSTAVVPYSESYKPAYAGLLNSELNEELQLELDYYEIRTKGGLPTSANGRLLNEASDRIDEGEADPEMIRLYERLVAYV